MTLKEEKNVLDPIEDLLARISLQESYKIVVIGSQGVGKTSLIKRISENSFEENPQNYTDPKRALIEFGALRYWCRNFSQEEDL